MKKNSHKCEGCKYCTKLNPEDILIEKSPCTNQSDAVYECPSDFYQTGSGIPQKNFFLKFDLKIVYIK